MVLPIHILAGGLAVVFGFAALFVRKGGVVHRRVGMFFVYAMLVMGVSASVLEFRKHADVANVVAALLSMYFVGTALMTVRPPTRGTRAIGIAALAVAVTLAALCFISGVTLIGKRGLSGGGVPFRTIGTMSFILSAVLSLSAAGDVRVMRAGMLRGAARLRRHLWRMCFALFIAAGSFFSIRERVAKVLPDPFTTGPMRALPMLLLFAAMFYWLTFGVRFLPGTSRTAATTPPPQP